MLGRLGSRALVTTAVALATLTTLAPGIARAGTWLSPSPVNLSDGSDPSVAVDSTGNAVVTWRTNPAPPAAANIQAAHHLVGSTTFTQLPDLTSDATLTVNATPVVAMNRHGDGIIAWAHDVPAMAQLELRTIAPDGTVGPIVMGPVSISAASPAVAINDNGDAVVAWLQSGGIEAITRQGLNGSFTNLTTPDILDPTPASAPTAAIDSSGNSIVAWKTNTASIAAKLHPAGGSWSLAPQTIATAGHAYANPSIAANPFGQLVVAFQDSSVAGNVISSVTGTVSGGWGLTPTPTTLSGTGVTNGPAVAIDDPGDAAVAWTTGSVVQVSRRVAGGSFPLPAQAETITAPASTPDSVALGGNGSGEFVVAWHTFDTGPMVNVVRASARPAGAAAFEASKVISDTSAFAGAPAVAVDENGDAVVAFPLGNGAPPQGVSTAVYDGAGPLLAAPAGPSSVTQGAPASFSIPQPKDAFSNVSSVSWSFGDGSAAVTGAQVTHTFTKTGTFTVSVTATDAVGNASTATLHVTVGPGGPNPQPCVVPNLKGKSLSKAKSLLKSAHCALGKVTKPKKRRHHKLGKLVVKSSSPKAGSTKPAGTKVNLTLTKAPKTHKHTR